MDRDAILLIFKGSHYLLLQLRRILSEDLHGYGRMARKEDLVEAFMDFLLAKDELPGAYS